MNKIVKLSQVRDYNLIGPCSSRPASDATTNHSSLRDARQLQYIQYDKQTSFNFTLPNRHNPLRAR